MIVPRSASMSYNLSAQISARRTPVEYKTSRIAARLRKERGVTQQELAERIGTIQALISDYERDRLRVRAEMVVRIAAALEITADELLGIKKAQPNGSKPSRKILRRLEKIDELRPQQQATLLRTIDTFLRGAAK